MNQNNLENMLFYVNIEYYDDSTRDVTDFPLLKVRGKWKMYQTLAI